MLFKFIMVIEFLLLLSEAISLISGHAKYLVQSDNCIIYANIANQVDSLYTVLNSTFYISVGKYPSNSLYNTLYVNPDASLIDEQFLVNTSAALLFDKNPRTMYAIVICLLSILKPMMIASAALLIRAWQ